MGIVENWRTIKLLNRVSVGDVREMRRRCASSGHDLRDTGYMIRILEGMAEKNDRDGGISLDYADWEAA